MMDEMMRNCGICHLPLPPGEEVWVWLASEGKVPSHKVCAEFFEGSRPPLEERKRRLEDLEEG
jgi:hypothetical protein